jgi:uncharacterized protein YbjT (DUF2867 family)
MPVIGGTGFIGPWVVSSLSEQGHQVAIFHRGQSNPSRSAGVRHICGFRPAAIGRGISNVADTESLSERGWVQAIGRAAG